MVETWLFIGNPGVGKSTLLNCLAQRFVFPSGLSFGGGLTKDIQTCVDDKRGVIYTDTPGLADGTAERGAAEAITRALRSSGPRVKLCFVIRLQAGTVVGEDIVTMDRVLDSIRVREVPFGVIINIVDQSMCRRLVRNPYESKRLVALVNTGKYTTPHIIAVPEIDELIEATNCVVKLPQGMRRAIERFPTACIPIERIDAIHVEGFSTSVVQTKRMVSAMDNDKAILLGKQDELVWKKPEFWKIATAAMGVLGTMLQMAVGT